MHNHFLVRALCFVYFAQLTRLIVLLDGQMGLLICSEIKSMWMKVADPIAIVDECIIIISSDKVHLPLS